MPSRLLAWGASLTTLLAAAPALAQTAPPEEPSTAVEDIVVTAQRREQTLQDVPISVSVFSAETIRRARVDTVDDLVALTPGVSGAAVATTTPRITIRGVSTDDFGVGSDPALGVYVDDVYLGRGVSSISDLFDIARVEVVKGPQGTLFGRNTTAGAISITTRRPGDSAEGELDVSYGRFDDLLARGAVNLPLGDGLALRLAGSSRTREGPYRNTLGGRLGGIDSQAGRATLGYDGSGFDALFSVEHRSTRNLPGASINPDFVGGDRYGPASVNLASNTPERARDDIDATRATLRLEAELSDAITLTSITAYNGFKNDYLEDTDASPLTLLHFGTRGKQDSYSQELRLNGEAGRLTWFVGASAARDEIRSDQTAAFSEKDFCPILFGASCLDATGAAGSDRVAETSFGRSRNTSLALYTDLTYALTDRVDLIGGLRYSHDRKRFAVRYATGDNLLGPIFVTPPPAEDLAALGTLDADGTLNQRYSQSSWQPRLAINVDLTDRVSAYASASRGFKAGGFNQLVPGPAFGAESIWNYEVGLKGDLIDRRLRFDLSAFYYEYSDLQVLIDFAGSVITRNAGSATGYGAEAQLVWRPVDTFSLSLGAAYLDATYDTFRPSADLDYSGNRLPRAPKFSGNIVGDLDLPRRDGLSLLGRVEASYRSEQFYDPSNSGFERQAGYALVNLSGGLGFGDRFEVRAFVQNLLDEEYLIDTSVTVPGLLTYTQRGEPRTYGVQLLARF